MKKIISEDVMRQALEKITDVLTPPEFKRALEAARQLHQTERASQLTRLKWRIQDTVISAAKRGQTSVRVYEAEPILSKEEGEILLGWLQEMGLQGKRDRDGEDQRDPSPPRHFFVIRVLR